ncbi:EAL domain-containing protein [bacterium]|nr:EAL domain-containing protein [bacterium]MBU1995399.1 EAL domain-containing protein [bacterium]
MIMGLVISSFVLTSSGDISDTLQKVSGIGKDSILIHIVSYIHNTVLVQNLKSELQKLFPHAKIVLLKHPDKFKTILVAFTLDENVSGANISDEILKELHFENIGKDQSIESYRNKLLNRYFTDHLTNLPNLYQLRKDLGDNDEAGLILFNIDNFKTINNFYGFIVGDYVIEEVGKALVRVIENHQVYRMSSDEFAIILEKNMGFYDLKEYISTLYQKIKNIVIEYQNNKIFVDLTLASCANRNNQDMFSKVSMALKYAKENGVAFWIYEDRMHFENEYEKNLLISSIVRNAVESSRIVPYFQAIMDNKNSKIVKYECLARLIDENEKVLSPVLFIPIAKKIKVYNRVTKNILDKSFAAFEDNEFEFSINLSIEDIMSGEIFKYIITKLKNSKASTRVTFELLESEAIQDFKKVERFIGEVKRYGAKIAIDDFGSGYSNFSYLTKMGVDYIKIDGSLIKDIDVDKNALLVVETIVQFAKKLGIKTIAEYVCSSTVMNTIKSLGIDYSQGFYIDEPSVNLNVLDVGV